MAEINLSVADQDYLRACPQRVNVHRMAWRSEQSVAASQYTRLRAARLITGRIDADKSTRELLFIDVALTDAGRAAIGLPIHGGDDADQHA